MDTTAHALLRTCALQQLLNVTGNNLLDQMYQATPLDASTDTLDVRWPFLPPYMLLPPAGVLQSLADHNAEGAAAGRAYGC